MSPVSQVYPVTIVRTRYSGVYEGGAWAAFDCDAATLPLDAYRADDTSCAEWWDRAHAGRVMIDDWVARSSDCDARRLHVAVGSMPNEALAALEALVHGRGG
jgi:hypothetical protein